MSKITFIGAGSIVFTRNLCSDILLTPALQDSTISLMDIDPVRLERSRKLVQAIIDRRGLKACVEATTDRREAVRDARFVITTFQQGGLDAYTLDIDIPRKYGVEQCVGDTLGPGGVFRGLRTIPVLLDLCDEMDEFAPDALLLNYVNPMAINCWAVADGSGRPHVGLCHSVQGTSEMLARWIGIPYDEVSFLCAGINHQAFFLEFRRGAEDLYPLIREAIERDEVMAEEPVRGELMKYFGYFVTESSGHASEYVPYYRKTASMVTDELSPLIGADKEVRPLTHELVERVSKGIKRELLPIVKLEGIGRVRGRIIFNAGYKTIEDLRLASIEDLTALPSVGPRLAKRIKEQVGGFVKKETWDNWDKEQEFKQQTLF